MHLSLFENHLDCLFLSTLVCQVNTVINLYFHHCFLANGFLVQPPFLVVLITAKDNPGVEPSKAGGLRQPVNGTSSETLGSVKASLVDALLQVIERSGDLINRYVV